MEWDAKHVRATGLVVDLLRNRWNLATIYALEGTPLRPGEIEDLLQAAAAPNVPVFGLMVVSRECVHRRLGYLLRVALLDKKTDRTGPRSETRYRLTALALDLLESLHGVTELGTLKYRLLVALSRAGRGADPAETFAEPGPPDPSPFPPEPVRVGRRATVLVFGHLLRPAWTFTVLAALSAGPLSPGDLRRIVNEAQEENPDVLTSPALPKGSLYRLLGYMVDVGLLNPWQGPELPMTGNPPRSPDRPYALSYLGILILAALEPIAEFGVAHDAELAVMAVVGSESKTSARARQNRRHVAAG